MTQKVYNSIGFIYILYHKALLYSNFYVFSRHYSKKVAYLYPKTKCPSWPGRMSCVLYKRFSCILQLPAFMSLSHSKDIIIGIVTKMVLGPTKRIETFETLQASHSEVLICKHLEGHFSETLVFCMD